MVDLVKLFICCHIYYLITRLVCLSQRCQVCNVDAVVGVVEIEEEAIITKVANKKRIFKDGKTLMR